MIQFALFKIKCWYTIRFYSRMSKQFVAVLWPRTKFAIADYDFLHAPCLWSLLLFARWVYERKLLLWMVYALMKVSVRILFYRHFTSKTCGHVYWVQYSLEDKRSLSLGELIRPFCITISTLYFTLIHRYILYLGMILMLFHLFLHVWWLSGRTPPEPGFCWKKHREDTIFLKTFLTKGIYRSS
jgi:hypothetical protein